MALSLSGRMFLFVCNKTGSYILIETYKEPNPIHAAQTPNLSILLPNKLDGGGHLESVCVCVRARACVCHPSSKTTQSGRHSNGALL